MANSTDDPIENIQQRVYHACAMVRCLAEATEPVSTFNLDLLGAFLGVADVLNSIHLELDPKTFRAAVLASEIPEVANG